MRIKDKTVVKPLLIYNYGKHKADQMINSVWGVEGTRKSHIRASATGPHLGGTEVLDANRSNPHNSSSNPAHQNVEMVNYN